MNTLLFVSPHLDDAVFSCAVKIRRACSLGHRVVVATVFSEGRDHAARRVEDAQAAAVLGAEARCLGFVDALDRDAFYQGFETLLFGLAAGDHGLADRVARALETLIGELGPVAVHAPLAVGTHADHRLCFEAVRRMQPPVSVTFYEDRPYSLAAGAVELRLRELGYDAGPLDPAAVLRAFRRLPHVRAYLPPGETRRRCESLFIKPLELAPQAPCPPFEVIEANAAEARLAWDAAAAYASQFAALCGSRRSLQRRDRHHARHLHSTSPRAERYWTLPPNPIP